MRFMIKGLLVAASFLAAGQARAEVQLTFRYVQDNVGEVQQGIAEFERRNPGIKVNFERIAIKDARDQFIREAATGGGPDVVHLAFVWVKDLGVAGACMKLNDLIEHEGIGEKGWSDFIATDLTYGPEGKSIYGVPFATDTWAMVYNKKLLETAGIAKVPETWDELLAASRAVKAKTGKTGFGFAGGVSGNAEIWFLANFNWWSDGGSLVVDDGKGGYKLGITADQVASVIDYYKTYLDEGLTTPGSVGLSEVNAPELVEPMLRGESAAVILPVFNAVSLFKAWRERNPGQELPFTTAMTPHGSGKPTTHLGGQSLCVNANTEHKAEAWKLMQWLNSWAFWEKYNTIYYPAQKSLLAKRPFPPEMTGFQKQFTEGARSWGPYARGPAPIAGMWNQVARSFGQAFIGERTSKQAAEDILAYVQGQLKQ